MLLHIHECWNECCYTDRHTDFHTDGKMNKINLGGLSKKPTLCLSNASISDTKYLILSICGGCHPEGFIVDSFFKLEQYNNYNNNNEQFYKLQSA